MKSIQLIIISMLIISAPSMAGTIMCDAFSNDLEKDFYSILLGHNAKKDPINEALEFLPDVEKNSCKFSSDQLSLILDLSAETARIAYKLTGEERFFNNAKDGYEKALIIKASRNERIYWHLALLHRSAGKYEEAIQYINKVLQINPKPNDPMPYLETGFQLSVDTKNWKDAGGLLEELMRRNDKFYADVDLLYSSIVTLCHFKDFKNAKTFIGNVEKYVELNESEKKRFQESKNYLHACEKNITNI